MLRGSIRRHHRNVCFSSGCSPGAASRRRTISGLSGRMIPLVDAIKVTMPRTERLSSLQNVSVLHAIGTLRSLSSGARTSRGRSRGARSTLQERNRNIAIYMASIVVGVIGVSYAAVPLYKIFCQVTGFGGTTQVADAEKARKMTPVDGGRMIRVTFDATVADTMPWKFRPTQGDVKVVPGETALAFFTANNPTRKHITGVATYNVFPLKAGIYFNKIQCFCFEEQRLRAGEEIDMPVFFFLDPEMLDDPAMDNVNNVTLSYTFFQTAEENAVEEEDEEEEKLEGSKQGGVVQASGESVTRRGWRGLWGLAR